MCDKIICYFCHSPGKAPLLVPSLFVLCWSGSCSRRRLNSAVCEVFVTVTMWASQTICASLWGRSGLDVLQLKRSEYAVSLGCLLIWALQNPFEWWKIILWDRRYCSWASIYVCTVCVYIVCVSYTHTHTHTRTHNIYTCVCVFSILRYNICSPNGLLKKKIVASFFIYWFLHHWKNPFSSLMLCNKPPPHSAAYTARILRLSFCESGACHGLVGVLSFIILQGCNQGVGWGCDLLWRLDGEDSVPNAHVVPGRNLPASLGFLPWGSIYRAFHNRAASKRGGRGSEQGRSRSFFPFLIAKMTCLYFTVFCSLAPSH